MAEISTEGQSSLTSIEGKDNTSTSIPVCTLFNNPEDEKDPNNPPSASVSTTYTKNGKEEPTNQEPILCDVFKSNNAQSINDDIFLHLGEKRSDSDVVGEVSTVKDNEMTSSPSKMEDLKLVPSVDSFIIDDLSESEVDNSKESQKSKETMNQLGEDPKTTVKNSQSFISINSFSDISPEEPTDCSISEVNDTGLALEKLTLNDSNDNLIEDVIEQPAKDVSVISGEFAPEQSILDVPKGEAELTNSSNLATSEENLENPSCIPFFATSNMDKSGLFSSPEKHNIFATDDDPFATALSNSELDRRRDAWIPSSSSTVSILSAVISHQKTIQLEVDKLTRPRLASSEILEDPVKEFVIRMTGSETILKRQNLTLDDVCQNIDGVKQLIETGNLRAAANLCSILLEKAGQGFGESSPVTTSTPETLQIWLRRIFALTKLNLFDLAQSELEPFKDLENPDMFYEFYPDLYPGRRGSMVPFAFRLLYAEFPCHTDSPQKSLKRLHKLLNVCNKILNNLAEEKNEIGEVSKLNSVDKDLSVKFWTNRKVQVMYAISNTLMRLKEYDLVIEVLDEILILKPEDGTQVQSDIGRVFLQMGDIRAAQLRFTEAEKLGLNEPKYKMQLIMNRGFMYIGTNNWKEAFAQFELASGIAPANIIALNNKAVCLLYLGKLKGAIAVLESGIANPDVFNKESDMCWQQSMAQGLIANLSTLYELESSRYVTKKRTLFLKHIAPCCGDGFDTTCLKEI